MQKKVKISFIILFIILGFFIARSFAQSSGSSGDANLTIWDDTDSLTKYSECSESCGEKGKSSDSYWNIKFYANYTNSTGNIINETFGNGNCSIRFNETGVWSNWFQIYFNNSLDKWIINKSFNYKGNLTAHFNCTSDFGNVSLYEEFFIANTVPYILTTPGNYIDFDGDGTKDILQCTEDTLCSYNFSSNVSEDDLNDVLTYGYDSGSNTTLTNFSLNSSTSILEINVTNDADAGSKKIELNVRDTGSSTISALLDVDISEVNDAPLFSNNLANQSFNITQLFEIIVNVTDEENNIPFSLNVSFMSCSVASWSDRNCSNSSGRELFNSSQYSFNSTTGKLNISFIPEKNDVGSYIINFSVKDTNNNVVPYNASTSKIVNLTVLNVNSAPYFRYVCDDERDATEDSEFICRINATDIDETSNLTLTSNYGWFKFDSSNSNSITETCNKSTSYNISALVNFTSSDEEVGNWSVNITIRDTGSPQGINSTVFWFFIDNIEDIVYLDDISNLTIYENTTIYVNATDDDLLVPDSDVKDESLSFASNVTWIDVSTSSSADNYTTAKIDVNYNYVFDNLGEGNYTVSINVSDTGGNMDESNFTIEILGDNPPVWNETMQDNFTIYENNITYLNFSQNVTDADGDDINFSYTNDTSFPSFSIDAASGVINFTPIDEDVGQHIVTITASDNKLSTDKIFNFTIFNVNEAPYIETPLTSDNASIDANSNIVADEDNYTKIPLWVQDDDFRIPEEQKEFYNESLNLNLTIQGPNTDLFSFVKDPAWPTDSGSPNKSKYEAIFTPNKSDVGTYNITINITDQGNLSAFLQINLTVQEVEHAPILMNLTNKTTAVNRNLYYDINATDVEEKNDSTGNLTYEIDFLQGNDFINGNESIFNITSGILDIVFNLSQGGAYQLNISVNDTEGLTDNEIIWVNVYDFPNVTFPNENSLFNLTENETLNMIFRANHSVGNNLTYEFLIDSISYFPTNTSNFSYGSFSLRESTNYYGNNTNLSWQFTPTYSDETYGKLKNLTLRVYPLDSNLANKTAINSTINFKLNISHKNSPLSFSGNIGGLDEKISGTSPQSISLSDYFYDADASDAYYYQKVTFNYELINSSGGTISVSITNWINGTTPYINFSSSEDATANYSVIGYEYNISNSSHKVSNITSNNFTIELDVETEQEPSPTPTPSSGGSSRTKPVSLKIILPDPVSAYKNDVITLPIKLSNTGEQNLKSINLSYLISKNGSIAEGIRGEFTKHYFENLDKGKQENTTLTIYTNTNELGLYEITINASVESPEYHDWGKIYLTVREANKSEALEKILFTEEFIAENPECIEIKEVVEEAREYYEKEYYSKALEKAREAINSCRYAITQAANPQKTEQLREKNLFYRYLSYSILFAVFLSVVYYFYKRIKLRKRNLNKNIDESENNPEDILGFQGDANKG